jgi:lipid-A-disaccharide synthase
VTDMPGAPLVYLIAGEESGDRLGAPLMAALKQLTGGEVRFAGVGGAGMAAEGLESLFPMDDLAVMGVAEVLPRLPLLLRRMREVAADVRRRRPAVLVTIDAPDFNFRVAKRLKGLGREIDGIKLVHYVAPTVWAWRPGRAKMIAGDLDHLLALLPFEPPYFDAEGLACTYVGHPVLRSGADKGDGVGFRQARGIATDTPLLALLPGSRRGECRRMLPVFSATVRRLVERFPKLEIAVPTLPGTRALVEAAVSGFGVPIHLVEGDGPKYDAFAAADVALAASGTVTLELAMAGTPAVIGYRMALPTAVLARLLVKAPYAGLVNIMLGREAVPEYLLEQCHDDLMADALAGLFSDPALRDAQKQAYADALGMLGYGRFDPNQRAAETVLGVMRGAK